MMYRVVVFVGMCMAVAVSHKTYQALIPNGAAVPDPCEEGSIWEAVGHFQPHNYTLTINQFGKDFAAADHTWTVALCQMDSDGDGATNGEELGDPDCAWVAGADAPGPATGHPGLCEPIGSDACSGGFVCACVEEACLG